MGKSIVLITVLTIILLFFTKSLYVERTELIIIIGSLSIISIIKNSFFKYRCDIRYILGSSALIGFLFYWIFGLTDLAVDHYMYYLPTGNEDGKPPSLGFKIEEYFDDLVVESVESMLSVLVITVLFSKLFSVISAATLNPSIS